MNRKATSIFLFFLLFLFLAADASALKVTGRVMFNFDPGSKYKGQVCIVPEGMTAARLEPRGVLAEQIELEKTVIDLSDGPACVPYRIVLPEEMEPGIQKSEIRVTEKPPERGGTIVALVSVGHQIWVDVPYPGKYLEIGFNAPNADSGEVVHFQAGVTSKGKETIDSISGHITVYDWNDEIVAELDTSTIEGLKTQQGDTLWADWNSTGNTVGDYRAVLEVNYDGIEDSVDSDFKLGSLEIRLMDYTRTVYKKGIVPFSVKAESYWSEPVSNVWAHVDIINRSTEFDTLTKTLQPWETKYLQGYLDTTTLPLGNHTINMTLHYEELQESYIRVLEVAEEPVPVVEQPGLLERMDLSTTTILLMTTILFALIAVVLVVKVLVDERKGGNRGNHGGQDPGSPPSGPEDGEMRHDDVPDKPQTRQSAEHSSQEGEQPPRFQNF